jgi:F420-non-reducing hydrogenase large subunit
LKNQLKEIENNKNITNYDSANLSKIRTLNNKAKQLLDKVKASYNNFRKIKAKILSTSQERAKQHKEKTEKELKDMIMPNIEFLQEWAFDNRVKDLTEMLENFKNVDYLKVEEERQKILNYTEFFIDFAKFTVKIFHDIVLKNKEYVDLILSDTYTHRTYYIGLVDDKNKVNFYDGKVRVVDPDGNEICKYSPREYLDNIAEHIEPWTYLKFPYLKKIGWKGFIDGIESGVYRATPLSRLNASDGMATPLAQEEYESFYETLTGDRSGKTPVHFTLATHWARIIELVYAAELANQLAKDPEITSPDIRVIPTAIPSEGIGIVEAPRGTLTHHYITDEKGLVKSANLIVGTTNNYAAIAMSIKKAAKGLIKKGVEITDGILNRIEMAFRAYDPCFGCATHFFGERPFKLHIYDCNGNLIKAIDN